MLLSLDAPGTPTWSDTLILPVYVAVGSLVTFLGSILWQSRLGRRVRASFFKASPLGDAESSSSVSGLSISDHIAGHGGITIFVFKIARLVGCLTLLAISLAASMLDDGEDEETSTFVSSRIPHNYIQFTMCGVYFYEAILAIMSISAGQKWSRVATKHVNTVLLSTFIVYFCRDIFPLATFALTPMDLWEGQLLWPKVIILFGVSVIVPIFIPRQYIPYNPKKPMVVANSEQTASIFSSALYIFLDPIIALAYRIPHLDFDQLPPLCDYDEARHLKAKAFPHLDAHTSGKKRHVSFAFLWIFRWEFLSMAILLAIVGLSNFVSPLALNRLLSYLEDPSADYFMKPWFWILLLFLGPVTYTVAFQWDIFIATRIMVQASALVMQLVFEHALRIRVNAGSTEKGNTSPETEEIKPNLVGKINNLLTIDRENIGEARNVLFIVILVPIQIIGSVVFLYQVLGWSAFVGIGAMVAFYPLPRYVTKLQSSVQKQALEKTDSRVQTVSETMSVLRMIKMFGWEKQVYERISEKRAEELKAIWWRKILYTTSMISISIVPTVTMLITYATYTIIMKEELSAAKVFSSMAVFDVLRAQLWFTFHTISMIVKSRVSLDRLNDFLHNTELLDSFGWSNPEGPTSELVGFRDAMFTWSNDNRPDGALTPSSRGFTLKIKGELFFKPGLSIVVGPTGSGKTSLLMALLGEMHLIPSPTSWFNLPRAQGVSYAAQESWVLNDTIKNNILFNAPMDIQRYKKVLYQCCLERDLELFDAGDETEVGEKGLTLSGGQKARVTLARAIYADTRVVLLDDIFSALDVHTAKWIAEKCLAGDLIKNRTVILVTHNVALTSNMADFVVSVGLDGRVHSSDSIAGARANDELFTGELEEDPEIIEIATEVTSEIEKGKLIAAEEIAIGRVSWDALTMFFSAHSAGNIFFFFTGLAIIILLTAVASRFQTWYLGYWAGQYGKGTSVPVLKYIGSYSLILLGATVVNSSGYIYFTLGSFNASKAIHKQLFNSVVGSTFRWLDVTPTSRIIARFTADINAVDDSLSEGFWDLTESTVSLLTRLFAIVIFAPPFFAPGAFVGALGIWCGRVYMSSQLSVKRERSNARAPILAHIDAAIGGLVSVRAYGAQDTLIQISLDRIDRFTRASRTFANLNRWVTVRTSFLSALFTASLAYYLVYFQSHQPSNVGFVLTMALGFSSSIMNWVHWWNQFEVQSNSLERVKQYIEIEQEPKARPEGVPPAYWPASGNLSVDNLSAQYSPDGPVVLRDIKFNIKSGERVGIVGRTGSGKSSLTLALLRCIFINGTVYYDGLPTSSINLDALRKNVTIIPQIPELLTGSLRYNLDPFAESDDAVLNNALRAAGLSALQEDMEDGKLTLDSEISAGGKNLSVGQRQIIALARAIVRGSKLLILDEATSAIDYKTDAVIQTSLRTELPGDTTCLIVAHRLQSVMDTDKIMVLDAGRIVEFDSPKALLQNEQGMLRALVDESGDKDALYKMAQLN
ncbi:ATP-binding cassette transporter [Mycena sanguinolenta]|uniref:ATP-binding cassette transporter n=1 Tax=Mycena sanguinolenta TaxID=230812 RepID=A0A8H6ZF63_9AGAR|nr:ATP-binding cassette transporter [Mycena sanguinolenta]